MKKYFVLTLFLTLISCLFILSACNSQFVLPEYLYNSYGEYIGFCENDFLYDKESKKAIAKFDYEKKVFFNNDGYYGEIYKDNYIVYNNNSVYKDEMFGGMPTAPYAPIHPAKPKKPAISLPSGYRDCVQTIILTKSNISDFSVGIFCDMDGYAGYYVYFNNFCRLYDNEYTIKDTITISFTLTVTYRGYLKNDTTQSKIFTKTTGFIANSNYVQRQSIYDLGHKDYGYYEEVSQSIVITGVSGTLIKNN